MGTGTTQRGLDGLPFGSVITDGINDPAALQGGRQKTDAQSHIIAPTAIAQGEGWKATYVYAAYGLTPYATPTDWIMLQGVASGAIINVTRVELRCYATAVAYLEYHLVKRTVDNTGGTRASQSAVIATYDSNDAATTGTLFLYTVVPTALGAGIDVRNGRILVQSLTAAAGANTDMTSLIEYGIRPSKAITLRGVAQSLCINFNGIAIPAGAKYDVLVEWTQE